MENKHTFWSVINNVATDGRFYMLMVLVLMLVFTLLLFGILYDPEVVREVVEGELQLVPAVPTPQFILPTPTPTAPLTDFQKE